MPPDLVTLFRSNVRAVRQQLGISQAELGRRVGKTPGYISDLERGRRAPNLTTLGEIAEGLGVLPSMLVSAKVPQVRTNHKKR